MNLFDSMLKHKVNNIIFSSSATVYGNNPADRFTEDMEIGIGIANPYGRTKVIMEQILQDYTKVFDLKAIALRYFNPIGTMMHCNQKRKATDLMTALTNPAKEFKIFGDTY
jgi:UDP-glucose 4-epimerase